MNISVESRKMPFTQLTVEAVPHGKGVYILWDNDKIVYVGVADGSNGLYGALVDHISEAREPGATYVRYFQVEVCAEVGIRQKQLLEECKHTFGSYPQFNDKLLESST